MSSSHLYQDRAGMSYLERTYSQRHWAIKRFYRGKHKISLAIKIRMAILSMLVILAPVIKAVLWVIDLPFMFKRNWKQTIERITALGLVVVLITYLIQ